MAVEYVQYLQGIFSISLVILAFFISLYAFLFLKRTKKRKERRPWDFLFIASLLFLFFEVLSFLHYFNIFTLNTNVLSIIGKAAEFFYSGLILLAFVSQNDLIFNSHLILISREDEESEFSDLSKSGSSNKDEDK